METTSLDFVEASGYHYSLREEQILEYVRGMTTVADCRRVCRHQPDCAAYHI